MSKQGTNSVACRALMAGYPSHRTVLAGSNRDVLKLGEMIVPPIGDCYTKYVLLAGGTRCQNDSTHQENWKKNLSGLASLFWLIF